MQRKDRVQAMSPRGSLSGRSSVSGQKKAGAPAVQFVPHQGTGWLWTAFVKGWRPYHFVASAPGVLEYFSSKQAQKAIASISLSDATITPCKDKQDQLIIDSKRNYILKFGSKSDRDYWVQILTLGKHINLETNTKEKQTSNSYQSTEIQQLFERLQELQTYKSRFIAQLRQLRLTHKQGISMIEDLASDIVISLEDCVRLIQKSLTLPRSMSTQKMTNEDDGTFYSCIGDEETDESDESSEDDDEESREFYEESTGFNSLGEMENFDIPISLPSIDEMSLSQQTSPFWKDGGRILASPRQDETPPNTLWSPVSKEKHRQSLPHPKCSKGISLWSGLKDAVGKDLSRISFPANWNEPLNSLQRACEEMEYHGLLQKGTEFKDPLMRMLYVAAFAISGYGYTEHRTSKPFNPVLGETYEYEDSEIRFFSEQVSHHPPVTAFHTQACNYSIFGEMQLKNKFWGKHLELIPVGAVSVIFGDNQHRYTWNKVSTTVHNLVMGALYLTHSGEMKIQNHTTGDTCVMEFHKKGWFDNTKYLVSGKVYDSRGQVMYLVHSMWNEHFSYMPYTSGVDPRDPKGPWTRLWTVKPFPPNSEQYYNFTYFALGLNEITPQLRRVLPPTDTRLRPDQRLLEEGQFDAATQEKLRLEEKQREARRIRERDGTQWNPLWFNKHNDPILGNDTWVYAGGYWERRQSGSWAGIPDVFA